ncbi:MAG: hypothetical protein HRT89_18930, partial [Lentisphaeria bacterium]|nr:hypothetical protein [Lentisphaeria bacterium]
MKVGLFVSCNKGYIPYLNALLNSIEKRNIHIGVDFELVLVYYDFLDDYLEAITDFPFKIRAIKLDTEEIAAETRWSNSNITKSGRYYYMKKMGRDYDVACLMDADLFYVSENFKNYFQLINGTDLMINCNERFKWNMGPKHTLNEQPIFESQTRLNKFHCNTPMVLVPEHWEDVIDYYMSIVYRAKEEQQKDGETIFKDVGDIFSWNIAVQKMGKTDKVVLFPMEALTQVHQTSFKQWTELKCENGFWTTFSGEEVLCLHGRCGTKGFGKFDYEKIGCTEKKAEQIIDLYKREWYDLNFFQRLKLNEFGPVNEYW